MKPIMRLSAVVPIFLCITALILSFLCLFAGSKKGFMEEYAVVTLNTSRFGGNLLNTTSSNSSNSFINFFDDIINDVKGEINDEINDFAKDLGLHDFYSAHLLNFCEGFYTPTSLPNDTIPKSSINQNVTACSNRTAMYSFNPREMLQRELNETGTNLNLTELGWPDAVDDGIRALEVASNAMFILYCIGIVFIFLALVSAIASFFFAGRMSAFVNIIIDLVAFVTIGLASAIATAVAVKAAHVINDKGNGIGISAEKGTKFMILTWVATGCLFVASMVWCVDMVAGMRDRRRAKRSYRAAKHG